MTTNLTKEEALKVQNLVNNFNETYDANITIDENLVQFYLANRPGTFPEDAYDVVKKLHLGIDQFNAELQKALDNGDLDYSAELQELSKDLTLEQKYELYLNFLSAIMTLNANNLSSEQLEGIEGFREIKGRLKFNGEASEEQIAQLEALIAEQLKNNTLCIGTTDALSNLLSHLPEGEDGIEKVVLGSEKDCKEKIITSMATYIAYQNEELESLKGVDLTPEAIAISTAMGIEQNHIISDLHSGIISIDTAIKLLKIIGGVALIALIAVAAFMVVCTAFDFAYLMFIDLFGISTISVIAATIYAGGFSYIVADMLGDGANNIVEWASSTFDTLVDTWRSSIYPTIVASIGYCWNWISGKMNSGTIVEQETAENIVATAQA